MDILLPRLNERGKMECDKKTRYFEVVAKCGHVGRNQYYRGCFYIKAESGKEAAEICRKMPRVKHDHKDAILFVYKIDKNTYEKESALQKLNEPYFQCKSRYQQRLVWDEIQANIYPEVRRICRNTPKRKKPYKRERFVWDEEVLTV